TRLPHLDRGNARRLEIADAYTDALADGPVRPLTRLSDRNHVFHLFVVDAPARGALQANLAEAGIQTLIHYPRPVHGHTPYARLAPGTSLDVSERLCEHILSLPMYPELLDDEVERITEALRTLR